MTFARTHVNLIKSTTFTTFSKERPYIMNSYVISVRLFIFVGQNRRNEINIFIVTCKHIFRNQG